MANWCSNHVSFSGDPANILRTVQLFRAITYDQETNKKPGVPGFLKEEHINMVDFGVGHDSISFRTPWSPAVEAVRLIAEHFDVDYVHGYQEPGMLICGEASRVAGTFYNISINRNDLAGITYDSENEEFVFEGRRYDDDWGILAELLDRKREKLSKEIAAAGHVLPYLPDTKSGPELSQAELFAWRLAGRLPHIDINGTDFTIDIRLRELRETESPWNRIDLTDLDTALEGDEYEFFYDQLKHNIWYFEEDVTEMPENVVMVTLPDDLILDPVAAARATGYNEDRFLEEYPIQQVLRAGVRPLSETFFPKFIAENREAKYGRDPGEEEERPRKIGR